jgi:hypothetical protein
MSTTTAARKPKSKTPPADLPQGQAPSVTWADVTTAFDAVHPGIIRRGTLYMRSLDRGIVFKSDSQLAGLVSMALTMSTTPEEFDGYIVAARNAVERRLRRERDAGRTPAARAMRAAKAAKAGARP